MNGFTPPGRRWDLRGSVCGSANRSGGGRGLGWGLTPGRAGRPGRTRLHHWAHPAADCPQRSAKQGGGTAPAQLSLPEIMDAAVLGTGEPGRCLCRARPGRCGVVSPGARWTGGSQLRETVALWMVLGGATHLVDGGARARPVTPGGPSFTPHTRWGFRCRGLTFCLLQNHSLGPLAETGR